MKILFKIFLFISFLELISCVEMVKEPVNNSILSQKSVINVNKISLNGKWKVKIGYLNPANLYLPTIDDSNWKEIYVPSNWYLQGIDYSGVLWYRRHFKVSPNFEGKIIKIVFEGVDYTADVWLNGEYIGFHEGYFQHFSFDITNVINYGGDNVLVVRVDSPYEEPEKVWSLHKRLIKGIFNHHDTRPGGAWSIRGQDKNTGGIWGSVYLKISCSIAIEQLKITPLKSMEGKESEIEVNLKVKYYGDKEESFLIDVEMNPYNFTSEKPSGGNRKFKITLKPGINNIKFKMYCFNTHLWWSWDHGKPNLYKLNVKMYKDKVLLDKIEKVFGFRSIKVTQDKQWYLNGKRIFLRGTNYISSQWLSEMTKDIYAFDIALMKKANINAVRVHAHIEAENFYRIADEAGIMIWQDFPLQWGYTDETSFIKEVIKQAKDMVDMLYNHPSIIAWCLHNEPPWDSSWMKYKYKDYNPQQNKKLDEALFKALEGYDKTRYLHKYSSNIEHPWFGWYSGTWKDYARKTSQPLITEFGAQALPSLTSLRKIFTEEELWPDTEEEWKKWEYHNFQRRETFEIAGVKMGNNIKEFIKNTQQYQAKLIKYAAEAFRRQKYNPVGGIFQFMFVEDWPSINWGIVDYWRFPKAGYEALRIAYQPLLPIIEWTKDIWKEGEKVKMNIWIVNDYWKDFVGAKLLYTLLKNGKIIEKVEIMTHIKADSSKKITTFQKDTLLSGDYILIVKVMDNKGKLLGQNQHSFKVKAIRSWMSR